jgi:hypothetical protein
MNELNTIKVKLQAIVNNDNKEEILEECEFIISNKQPDSLCLYEHSVNSQICK